MSAKYTTFPMEVVICEEAKLAFKDVQSETFILNDGSTVTSNTRTVNIPAVEVDQKLLGDLKSNGVTTKLTAGDIISFQLSIGSPDIYKNGIGPGYMKLAGVGPFLYRAFGGHPDWMNQFKLQVALTPLLLGDGSLKLEPAEASYLFQAGQPAMLFHVNSSKAEVADIWNDCWPLCWVTTAVTLKINFTPTRKQQCGFVDPISANARLLSDEVLADTTVIAANKAEIKFHRCFLAVHSPVFEKMFQADMKEARTGVLELPDMSEESVRALREFLYVGEFGASEENCVICFELFKAGHKYAIQSMEAGIEQIFLGVKNDWWTADIALRLFLFVKDLEFPQLKCKAVQALKIKRRELKELPRYRDLFKEENANVAMELMECLAQDFN